MDPAVPAAVAPVPALALALARVTPSVAQALPGLLHPSPLLSSGQEVPGSERGACLWRPWLSSTNDPPRQVRKLVDWVSDLWYGGGSYLAVHFEPHASFCFGQAAGGVTAAEATKADSEFHHPVRLFWPKSRSFDYLYSAGEILLQNFPVQATINLYEDSNSEEDEDEDEDEEEEEEEEEEVEKEEANKNGPDGCVRVPGSAPHRATAHSPSPSLPLTCPN